MQTKRPNDLTLCVLSIMVFVAACVAHEAIGHGLACLVSGGEITELTSVYFHCRPSIPFIDAAGPLMNLLVAGACAIFIGKCSNKPPTYFLALLLAFSGLWGASYCIYSALANIGDLAFVLRDLSLEPRWLWRTCLGITGIVLYRIIVSRAIKFSPKGQSLYLAYGAAVAVAVISALFYQGPVAAALKDATLESAVAPIGLLISGGRKTSPSDPAAPVNWSIVALSAAITAIFWLTMGKGIYRA